jgi:hypothetical protein
MENIQEKWKKQLDEVNIKYFVIKVEDFFNSLSEEELLLFNEFLYKYNEHRKPKPINKYWIINRDEYNFKNLEEFLETLKENKND